MRFVHGAGAVVLALAWITAAAMPPPIDPERQMVELEARASVLRPAAQAGDAAVQWQLGQMLQWGRRKEALTWLRKAAAQGHEEALLQLANMLLQDPAPEENQKEAVRWLRKAAERGSLKATVALGDTLFLRIAGVANQRQGVTWYRRAAEKGDASAQERLGMALHLGMGVERDASQAYVWSLKAAQAGELMAQLQVAEMLQKGEGTTKDEAAAFRWYQRAAENAVSGTMALHELGRCYEFGLGVGQDLKQAAHYYEAGARANEARSQRQLARFLLAHRPTPQARIQAYAWLSLAMDSDWAFSFDKKELSDLAVQLTPAERVQAESLASQWRSGGPMGAPPEAKAVKR